MVAKKQNPMTRKLNALKKNWNDAKDQDDPFGADVDDGIYKMRVVGCPIAESKSSGRLQIDWQYKILEGDFGGELVHEYEGLEGGGNGFGLLQVSLSV